MTMDCSLQVILKSSTNTAMWTRSNCRWFQNHLRRRVHAIGGFWIFGCSIVVNCWYPDGGQHTCHDSNLLKIEQFALISSVSSIPHQHTPESNRNILQLVGFGVDGNWNISFVLDLFGIRHLGGGRHIYGFHKQFSRILSHLWNSSRLNKICAPWPRSWRWLNNTK